MLSAIWPPKREFKDHSVIRYRDSKRSTDERMEAYRHFVSKCKTIRRHNVEQVAKLLAPSWEDTYQLLAERYLSRMQNRVEWKRTVRMSAAYLAGSLKYQRWRCSQATVTHTSVRFGPFSIDWRRGMRWSVTGGILIDEYSMAAHRREEGTRKKLQDQHCACLQRKQLQTSSQSQSHCHRVKMDPGVEVQTQMMIIPSVL